MSFLVVKHLRKSFPSPEGGESLVVDVEKFSLQSESLCAMKGESGSGKTTFLHLLAGILKPDNGSIMLNGRDVSQLSEGARDRLRGRIDRLCISVVQSSSRFYLPGERIARDIFCRSGKQGLGQGVT